MDNLLKENVLDAMRDKRIKVYAPGRGRFKIKKQKKLKNSTGKRNIRGDGAVRIGHRNGGFMVLDRETSTWRKTPSLQRNPPSPLGSGRSEPSKSIISGEGNKRKTRHEEMYTIYWLTRNDSNEKGETLCGPSMAIAVPVWSERFILTSRWPLRAAKAVTSEVFPTPGLPSSNTAFFTCSARSTLLMFRRTEEAWRE